MTRSTIARQLPKRQRFRMALLLMSLLLFPITLYYFSPVLIMQSASEGVINASFIVFAAMFISSSSWDGSGAAGPVRPARCRSSPRPPTTGR